MRPPAPHERERQILTLWECGVGLGRWAREDALLGVLGSRPAALGARNAVLLASRGTLFGRAWPLKSQCPACGATCEFTVDSAALAEELNHLAAGDCTITVEVAGRRFDLRPPTSDDLRALTQAPDAKGAERALLARCVSGETGIEDLGDEALAELEAHLERLDPGAVVSFGLTCPSCGHGWSGTVDVCEALWAELQRAAETSLLEVDALARAYGWNESEILQLSPIRRAAYLQLAGAS